MERWRLEAMKAATALMAELIETFEAHEPQPPELEGISIREIEDGGRYDGLYEILGLCRTCNQVVSHMLAPDATGDELHRAFHCNCRGDSAGGYRLPRVVGGGGGGLFVGPPVFASDLRHAQGFGFDPFPAGRELR